MSGYIKGSDREQSALFPERLEDWIDDVRRQGIWNQDRRNLRECLAHLVDRIMRRVCGDASAAVRTSFA